MPAYHVVVQCEDERLSTMDWEGVADDCETAAEVAEMAYRREHPEARKLRFRTTRIRPPL